ncbi:MAG: hypothetical protein A3J49_04675 [Gallionellales bacterium RIFCSPHIGHO2_02_FULL_57_16]|nr:MAG: hypothetical protein A3J49_04675 [Gallionellales bacterium RIFCSPHIGHO2_02_FULL_57_16]
MIVLDTHIWVNWILGGEAALNPASEMILRSLRNKRISLQKRLDSELIIEGWAKRSVPNINNGIFIRWARYALPNLREDISPFLVPACPA